MYVSLNSCSFLSTHEALNTSNRLSSWDTATEYGHLIVNGNDSRILPVGEIWTIEWLALEHTNMIPDEVAHTPFGSFIRSSSTVIQCFSSTFQI